MKGAGRFLRRVYGTMQEIGNAQAVAPLFQEVRYEQR